MLSFLDSLSILAKLPPTYQRPGEQETPLAALVASTSNLAYISSDRSNPSHIQHDIMEGTASPSPFRFLSEEPLERPQVSSPLSAHIDCSS